MGNFGQRVRLVHKLAELAGAKKLTNSRSSRFGIDQIVRHHRVDLDGTHTLPDRPFHAQQADTVLVFHQLTNGTNTAITEVVDIVGLTMAVFQANQCFNHFQNVIFAQDADSVFHIQVKAHVHFHAANSRQVIAL